MPKVFIPSIKNQSGPSGQSSDEDLLFILLKNSSYQQRVHMSRHPLLDLAAQIKAEDMAEKNYFSHMSPDGVTANQNVKNTGYILPNDYFKVNNAVESLSIGGSKPEDNVNGWYKSDKHRPHVFGEDKFYREQECVGIGRSISKDKRPIYVFISAICME